MFPAELIAQVELQVLKGDAPKVTDAMEKRDYDQADLDAVLVALAEPPAPESLERFIVYGASSTTTFVRVSYLDTAVLPKADTDDRDTTLYVYAASTGELPYGEVDSSDCS